MPNAQTTSDTGTTKQKPRDAAPPSDGGNRGEGAQRGSEQGRSEQGRSESNGQSRTFTGEIKQVVRGAALEVVTPVAVAATTAAARYAVKKAPGLLKDQVSSKVEEAGGPKQLAGQLSDKLPSGLTKLGAGGGQDTPSGTGRGRRLPVQAHVDVAVPIDTVYNQWTQFEEFPRFMHRVERVEQRDDTHLMWHENIWGVRRQWEAEITEQRPNDRIAWRSTGGPKQVGVVAFSQLADNLTRVSVTLDFQPKGAFEKTASGTRITRRALVSDLMRFKAFIEMEDEESGAWRGRVEDGEVAEGGGEQPQDTQEPQAADDQQDDQQNDQQDDQQDHQQEPQAADEQQPADGEPQASDEQDDQQDRQQEPQDSDEQQPADERDQQPQASDDQSDEQDQQPQASDDQQDSGEGVYPDEQPQSADEQSGQREQSARKKG